MGFLSRIPPLTNPKIAGLDVLSDRQLGVGFATDLSPGNGFFTGSFDTEYCTVYY